LNKKILRLCTAALLMALTVVVTAFGSVQVPKSLFGGYIHLGDTVVFLCAYFLGSWYGAAVGGLGGALSDLIVAAVWAPGTLFIKAFMGLTAGLMFKKSKGTLSIVLAMLIPGAIMVVGYYFYEWLILGSFISAGFDILPNVLQAVISILAASICIPLLNKVSSVSSLRK